MATTKRKTTKKEKIEEVPQENVKNVKKEEKIEKTAPKIVKTVVEPEKIKNPVKKQKFNIGDIVFISKKADTDLNGFKLFPQYKKYTYTVEAYDEKSGVYSLRRLNLSLKLKEDLILAPGEHAHDMIHRRQF